MIEYTQEDVDALVARLPASVHVSSGDMIHVQALCEISIEYQRQRYGDAPEKLLITVAKHLAKMTEENKQVPVDEITKSIFEVPLTEMPLLLSSFVLNVIAAWRLDINK